MARLHVPDRIREGVSALLSLNPNSFEQLVAALESLPADYNVLSELSTKINIPNVNSDIISAISSLHLLRAARNESAAEFVQAASEAISAFNPDGSLGPSKERLLKIISVNSLIVAAKALTVLIDRERIMLTAKILTDVRYAFRPNPEEEPYGALILHTLNVSYHEGEDHKEFLLSIDEDDINTLKDALDRAEKKARVLREKLKIAKIADLSAQRK